MRDRTCLRNAMYGVGGSEAYLWRMSRTFSHFSWRTSATSTGRSQEIASPNTRPLKGR